MKKPCFFSRVMPLVLAIIIGTLSSCEFEQEYKYTETTRSKATGIKVSEPVIIKAKNDSVAFSEAYSRFHSMVQAMNSLYKTDVNPAYHSVPISFTLEDKNGRQVFIQSIADEYDAVYNQLSSVPDNKKAYADAEFGMSMKEVLVLDHFKGSKWVKEDGTLHRIEKVDKVDYDVYLDFYNDELYRVGFYSFPRYAGGRSFYFVNQDLENIVKVFLTAYGIPSYSYGMPNEGEIGYNSSKNLYRWNSRNKTISIDYSRYKNDRYLMSATITDKYRAKLKQEEREKENQKKQTEIEQATKDASKLF